MDGQRIGCGRFSVDSSDPVGRSYLWEVGETVRNARLIFYLAVFGLVASAVAHVVTFLGVNPRRAVPGIMVLGVMVLVVWGAMVFMARKAYARTDRRSLWDIILRHAPLWMRVLSVVLGVYAFFNFFFVVWVLNREGVPSTSLGPKALVSHGTVIRRLSDEEYEKHQAYSVRGDTGHWMVFYAVGMTALYSLAKEGPTKATEILHAGDDVK